MNPRTLLTELFPLGHEVRFEAEFFAGAARTAVGPVHVIGTVNEVLIGVELAHRLAAETLAVVQAHPGRPLVLMVDTNGQRPGRRDELLGIDGYLALIAKCLHFARLRGHPIVSLVYGLAVSGGFLATNLCADACFALPDTEIQVMNLPAMARITKIDLDRLRTLSRTSPVFAPGAENYVRMGAIEAVWTDTAAERLVAALKDLVADDHRRRRDGAARAGRLCAEPVSARVCHDAS
ncbi:MAG TPA: biotin-independent malonate decarboxylase subunit gamma [Steroidobacteraceae bacterium]|nr:biotin-independent malonate decarboxylase subunit gamma [Steroidobacteraceae bacterium]